MAKNAVILQFEDGTEMAFDCVQGISVSRGGTVTENPMEEGARIADGRERNPVMITISDGMVSDVHHDRVSGPYDPEATGYHTDFMSKLEEADEKNQIIIADLGKRGIYTNLLIESLNIDWTTETGFSIPVTMTLKEIAIATTKKKSLSETRRPGQTTVDSSATKRRFQISKNLGIASAKTAVSAALAAKATAITKAATNVAGWLGLR